MEPQSSGLIVVAGLQLAVAAVASVLWETRGALRLGRILARQRPGRGRRQLAIAALTLLGGALVILDTGIPPLLGLQVLFPAGMMIAWTSGLRDSALGEGGVRAGWFVRRYDELEEWRLTGEHLRWKLFGEWQACFVPPEHREDLRHRLENTVGDRESRFRN